ncbi:MAG: hypothetical protein QXP36_04995 [Conexivisphaerales archaeon]
MANPWSETIGSVWYHYTPYVKEMRFKVEGGDGYVVPNNHYSVSMSKE